MVMIHTGKVQLPDDIVSMGYKMVSQFRYEQVWYSKEHDFTGTDQDFIDKGYAYRYQDLGDFKRIEIK